MKTNKTRPVSEPLLNRRLLRLFLLACFIAGLVSSIHAASTITFEVLGTFDYPDAPYTFPIAINDANDVAGEFYTDASFGFIRFHDGQFSDPILDPNDTRQTT